MILDDDEEAASKLAPSAYPTLRIPEPVAGRFSLLLPDYETSQQQHTRKPVTSTFSNRFDSRFWRGTFFALAIYVFLSVVIGIPLIVTVGPPPNIQNLFLDDDNQAALPLTPPSASGGMVMTATTRSCDAWDSPRNYDGSYFTASVRHTLPANGLFSVRSNATDEVVPMSGGRSNLTVDINSDASETDVVMSIILKASSSNLLDAAHFCFASTGDERGYSVYFPQNIPRNDYLAFDIRVLFPRSSQLITASDFITYLPMFHQSFGSLSRRVRIQNINIAGAGVDILCDSLQADKIAVKTSFASLFGTFNVTQSIKLDNIEGPIHTNVTLINDPSTGTATYLVADTGNSDIVADVTMVAPSSSRSPQYFANLKTFNGSLLVNVAHDATTPPATLNLQVENSQADSRITLDSKFMGFFDLRTKLAPVRIAYAQAMRDATWHIYMDSNSSSSTRGWLGRGKRPAQWDPATGGKVSAVSSLGPISLQI
ncbi:hypothetical protein GGX14DRAFT_598196, partial [Mycena pura]